MKSRWRRGLLHHGLYALQVALGLLFQILFARVFGASAVSDAYFAGYVVLAFLGTLPLFLTEMFMQHYHEAKARGGAGALELFQSVSTITLGLGALLVLISVALVPGIASLAFSGFDAEARGQFFAFTPLLLASLLLSPLVLLNNAVLNAEMRFALPLLIAVFTPAANLIALLVLRERHGLTPLALAPSVGAAAAYGLQRWYIGRRLQLPMRFRWKLAEVGPLFRSSAAMRSGHLLYSLKDPLVASFLAHLPSGTMSLYFYAQRLIGVVHGLASAPVLQVFMARVSGQVSNRQMLEVDREARSTILALAGLFLLVVVPVALILPSVLDLLLGRRLSADQLHTVYLLFLALIPFYLVQSVEAPLAGVVISMRRARMVIVANIAFLATFGGVLASGWYAGAAVWALPLALGLAQLGNLGLYLHFCHRLAGLVRRT